MNEQLLCDLWQNQQFNMQALELNNGAEFQIIYPGRYSTDPGSAFLGAIIKIAGTLWVGDVILYLKVTDLINCEAQSNQSDKVILFVVWQNDEPDYKSRIPIFFLQPRVSNTISQQTIPTKDNQQIAVVHDSEEHYSINQMDQADNELRIINCLHELIGIYKKKAHVIKGDIRSLKVVTWHRQTIRFYSEYGGHAKHVPRLMLLGNWMTKAGFSCNDKVSVIPLTNMIIIIPQKQLIEKS